MSETGGDRSISSWLRKTAASFIEPRRLKAVQKFNKTAVYTTTGGGFVEGVTHSNQDFQEKILSKISLKSTDVVVDVASGDGDNADFLDANFGVQTVRGDLSSAALATQKGKAVQLIDASEKLPFDDNTVEFMLVKDSIEHFRDQKRFLEESVRVLREGGRLLIVSQEIAQNFFRMTHPDSRIEPKVTFEFWHEYANLVEKAHQEYPNMSHTPPYFSTIEKQIQSLASSVGLQPEPADNLPSEWKPTPEKRDWHPARRFVLELVKKA